MKARIGIIGVGIGCKHAANFARISNGELTALCDMNPTRLSDAIKRFGAKGYGKLEDMLNSEKLDGVMVCTPPYVRMPLIEQIASRGIAVFCEKPPAGDLETALSAMRALEKYPVINSVGFMYRWMDAATQLKVLIAGRTVAVCQITGFMPVLKWAREGGVSPDYFFKEKAGGPLIEQGVHLIDCARFILGDEVARVHARSANLLNPLTEKLTTPESVQTSMAWSKGTIGSHIHCWALNPHRFQILFSGLDFHLILDLNQNSVVGVNNNEPVDLKFKDDCYLTELEGFCDAILSKDQSRIRGSYADAVKTLAVAVAGMKSLDTGTDLAVAEIK